MQYVIWGAGWRGGRAIDIIGADKIAFFIDSSQKKIGTVYKGKQIKSIDDADLLGSNYVVLITPLVGQREIADLLDRKKIRQYLIFDDPPLPLTIADDSTNDIMQEFDIVSDVSRCAIYGIGWLSLYLYDYLQKHNVDVCLVSLSGTSQELLDCISSEYKIKELDCAVCESGILLDMAAENVIDKVINNESGCGIAKINDYLYEHIKFCSKQILKFKNLHQGKRCFIVATGPSLTVNDLDKLYMNHEICISMNRIYNIFPKTNWRPDYYVIEDAKMIEDLAMEIASLPLEYKFVSSVPEIYWEQRKANKSIKFNMILEEYDDESIRFSRNIERYMYNGRTVTYICMQLAAYMGFKEIYLLGVDFSYSKDIYAESNHFEGYQKHYKDIRLNTVDTRKQLCAYKKAKKETEALGIKIINATRGGKLEVFERKDFDKLFGE